MTEGQLFWRTKNGTLIELKRVSVKDFMELNPALVGVPIVYSVWPTPEEDIPHDRSN